MPTVLVNVPVRSIRAAMELVHTHCAGLVFNAIREGLEERGEDRKFYLKMALEWGIAKPQPEVAEPRDNFFFITRGKIGSDGPDPMAAPKPPAPKPERRSLAETHPEQDDDLIPV